ncbi:MAG: hypothetical protein CMP48_11750 [Rickettsiales bacterium]|nr:hypothetical protein [Rickettsiales bacterium]
MKKLLKISVFITGVVLLQQSLEHLGNRAFRIQKELIDQQNLEPAVFFYTDSEQALEAEKLVRNQIKESEAFQ